MTDTVPPTIPLAMPAALLEHARAAKGFMPPDEGEALFRAGLARLPHGPALEVGTYCGKSSIYLGAAAGIVGTPTAGTSPGTPATVFTVDHHRGSEENQSGWEHHDASLVDAEFDRMDTLPVFRKTIARAGLEDHVIAVVGRSTTVAAHWRTPLSLLFIDGGHGEQPAREDFLGWPRWVQAGGFLAIHDVFADPAQGGRPPYEQIYLPALASGAFTEIEAVGSLRILQRTSGAAGDPLA